MSGTIFTVVILIIGALIFGAGLYYLVREKNDLESKRSILSSPLWVR